MPRHPLFHPTRSGNALLGAALALAMSLPAARHAQAASEFLWGTATSGFQVEGSSPDSNWKRHLTTAVPLRLADPLNNSVDFWNRYEEDISNAASLGVKVFRVSVEWARVEPHEGQWDEAALQHYDKIIQAIRDHGMTPLITMLHFVYPGWVADRFGGFQGDGVPEAFAPFAERITQRWAGNGTIWDTINEPLVFWVYELSTIRSISTPGDTKKFFDNIVAVHKLAYDAAHRADPKARVTTNEAFLPIIPDLFDTAVLDRIQDKLDFVSFDYYYDFALNNFSTVLLPVAPYLLQRQPQGIYDAIKHFGDAYPDKPIYIMENGMPTYNGIRFDDVDRADDLRDHIFWVQRAVGDGYNVIGYNYWSLMDNYEWGSYNSRFGLYQVDVLSDPSLTRKPTSGVDAYRQIIAHGGVSDDYRPVLEGAICSLSSPPDSCLKPASENGPMGRLR